MTSDIRCYNCGHSLAALTLPLSRRDLCPGCSVHVHACRMCIHYDPQVLGQCREEEAEEVLDKRKVNFCEWFGPSTSAWDGQGSPDAARARANLDALFGDGPAEEGTDASDDDPLRAAEDLFK